MEMETPASPQVAQHQISSSEIELCQKLGEGSFGVVYQGKWRQQGGQVVDVAVKQLKGTLSSDHAEVQEFLNEISLVSQLSHPNIVAMLGASVTPDGLSMMVTELVTRGNLFQVLHIQRRKMKGEWLVKFCQQIASGMAYLHSQQVIHRDLKSLNLLVAGNWELKVCDFGLSRVRALDSSVVMTSQIGTAAWMAPELISGQHKYTEKVDVYSFAMVAFEMASNEIPFTGMSSVQISHAVVNENLRPVVPRGCPPNIVELIERCWSKSQEKRPGFDAILKFLEEGVKTDAFTHGSVSSMTVHAPVQVQHRGMTPKPTDIPSKEEVHGPAATLAPSAGMSGTADACSELVDMGFEQPAAEEALSRNFGNVERAWGDLMLQRERQNSEKNALSSKERLANEFNAEPLAGSSHTHSSKEELMASAIDVTELPQLRSSQRSKERALKSIGRRWTKESYAWCVLGWKANLADSKSDTPHVLTAAAIDELLALADDSSSDLSSLSDDHDAEVDEETAAAQEHLVAMGFVPARAAEALAACGARSPQRPARAPAAAYRYLLHTPMCSFALRAPFHLCVCVCDVTQAEVPKLRSRILLAVWSLPAVAARATASRCPAWRMLWLRQQTPHRPHHRQEEATRAESPPRCRSTSATTAVLSSWPWASTTTRPKLH
eukprot:TRINITY_DN9091_c0_g2_i2.p1 TRINITY_DN9091_c0_g2~~TRINITY_DN9091_c0_g2_i2.p1  ORF type:complete len:663 (-),score=140.89 TRINITY_DN9091_c0_g2_i2:631-2619(-)